MAWPITGLLSDIRTWLVAGQTLTFAYQRALRWRVDHGLSVIGKVVVVQKPKKYLNSRGHSRIDQREQFLALIDFRFAQHYHMFSKTDYNISFQRRLPQVHIIQRMR